MRKDRREGREKGLPRPTRREAKTNECVSLLSFAVQLCAFGSKSKNVSKFQKQEEKKNISPLLVPVSPLQKKHEQPRRHNGDDGSRRLEGTLRVVDEAPGRPARSRLLIGGAKSDERGGQEMVS